MFGDEPRLPYLRPPLSKEYLRGESELEHGARPSPGLVRRAPDRCANVDRPFVPIEPAARKVVLDDGRRVAFDRLLLSTGAQLATTPVSRGTTSPGCTTCATLEDADAIRTAAGRSAPGGRIGGGWIGAEVAASIRQLGLPVTMIADGQRPARARARDRRRDRLPRPARGARSRTGDEPACGGLPGRDRGRGGRDGRWDEDRGRSRRGRRWGTAANAAGRRSWPGGRQRDHRRRAPRDERARDLRRWRRCRGLASAPAGSSPRRALGQRAAPGPDGRPQHARPRRALRSDPIFLLGPVRPRHGVRRLRAGLGPRRLPGRTSQPRIRRVLAPGWPCRGRHERQRLAGQRRNRGHRRLAAAGRHRAPRRSGGPSR